ncbi:MAG: hypothetical protein INR66_04045 [Gordonia polyisoprenivorans]|nr:hypothetical protein [Gordonia polyisoprenivorans]
MTYSPPRADAAVGSNFNPGYIVDDRLFYDSSLMSEAQVQQFVDAKEQCAATAGNPGCLESYRESSAPRAANAYCQAYPGGTGDLASTIILKVARACSINPQVLLVTLQKEQGLVLSNNPSATRYRIAMGYGCPDTAACDTKYYGFANQLYSAAWQFQRYRANPGDYRYRAGATVAIQWHPNPACGASNVTIVNAATAGLYTYTPYQPNAAALANIYGSGDACSSYGNRNFFAYFTDWFGNPTITPASLSFTSALYADVLGRSASEAEKTFWGRLLMNGWTPTQVASSFITSDEYRLIRITSAYRTFLGREGESGGVQNWLTLMRVGQVDVDDVGKYFMASDEYLLAHGGTVDSFIAAEYKYQLGRDVTPGELPFWRNIVATQGRLAAVDGIWHSIEAARARVTAMYRLYLDRVPDEAGVQHWAEIAVGQGDATVRWQIIGSAEYGSRASGRFPNSR